MIDDGSRTLARTATVATIVALVTVSGCSINSGENSSSDSTQSKPRTAVGFAQFPDIAVPAGATMNVERSLVLGARDKWIGRLSMKTPLTSVSAYDFFLREMQMYRWAEITSVRSEISILTFARDERIATVKIIKRSFGGTQIDVTVSPTGYGKLQGSFGTARPADATTIRPR